MSAPTYLETACAVLARAEQKSWRIATAESCTGGMVAAALTAPPGASAVFMESAITYSNSAKNRALGVREKTLDAFGAVSEQVAREMADGLRDRSGVDLVVSITGIAGPGGSAHKPEGRVCFGISTAQTCHTETREFGALGRDEVRRAARDYALQLLLTALS